MTAEVSLGTAHLDRRDVAKPDVSILDDQVLDVTDRSELALRPEAEALIAVRHTPGADCKVGTLELLQVVEADAVCGHSISIEEDSDFPRLHAMQLDPGHTFDPFQPPFEQAVEHLVAVFQVALARNA